jgi:hypothetical protein
MGGVVGWLAPGRISPAQRTGGAVWPFGPVRRATGGATCLVAGAAVAGAAARLDGEVRGRVGAVDGAASVVDIGTRG